MYTFPLDYFFIGVLTFVLLINKVFLKIKNSIFPRKYVDTEKSPFAVCKENSMLTEWRTSRLTWLAVYYYFKKIDNLGADHFFIRIITLIINEKHY